jgi:integrase/recombinase XerC
MPTSPTTALVVQSPADLLVAAFLASRSHATLRAYAHDLRDFASWSGALTPGDAAAKLLSAGHGAANCAALAYRTHLSSCGLSPATVNRRLAALRSFVKLARTFGHVAWALEVDGPRQEAYRDTRGPGRDGVRLLLAQLVGEAPGKCRDRAILRLLYDLGLRRGEVVGLDVADVGPEGGSVSIIGKGRTQKETLTCPGPTATALRAWIATGIPKPDSPLFVAGAEWSL